jgi:hypothetical protein
MLTFTFAGDESRDGSLNFAKGASRYFVVTVIETQNPDELRDLLSDVRRKSYLPKNFDFHFHSLASAKLRNLVFDSLCQADFEAWAIIVDKTLLSDALKILVPELDFYLYFVSEVIRQIPPAKRNGGTLILDEYGYPEQTRDELKRILKAREIKHGFSRISVRRSQSESLIQVADLVAGAILRRDAHNQSEAFDMIAGKIKKLVEYTG